MWPAPTSPSSWSMAKAAARGRMVSPAGRLSIVGLGPGALPQITSEVCAALQQATDVIGYVPAVERARALLQAQAAADVDAIRFHASDNRVEIDRSRHALTLAAQGHRVVVVSSGDPGVFAMASAVLEAVDHATTPAEGRAVAHAGHPGAARHHRHAGGRRARRGPWPCDFCCINLSDNLKPWSVDGAARATGGRCRLCHGLSTTRVPSAGPKASTACWRCCARTANPNACWSLPAPSPRPKSG